MLVRNASALTTQRQLLDPFEAGAGTCKLSSGVREVVGESEDGRGLLAGVDRHHPDVVLMDIRIPHLDGIATTRLLGTQPSPPAVIVLTTFDADELVLRALHAGAAGFLRRTRRRRTSCARSSPCTPMRGSSPPRSLAG